MTFDKQQLNFLNEILHSSDDLFFIFDEKGCFYHVLQNRQEILLIPEEEFMGKNFREVLPPNVSDELEQAFKFLDTGAPLQNFKYSLRLGEKEEWFLAKIGKITNEAGSREGYLAQIRQITAKVEIENNLHRKEKMLEAIASVNKALIMNTNIAEAISEGIRDLGLAVNADRCYLFENNFDNTSNEFVTSQKFEWTSGTAEPQIDNPDLQNVPFIVVHDFLEPMMNRVPLNAIVSELPEGGGLRLALEAQDIISVLLMPIYLDDFFWGFVGFDDCQNEKLWSDAEVNILSSLASSISTALIRKAMEDDLRNAKEIAESANLAKSEFLANISHEIRTPLSGVVGFSSLLKTTNLDNVQKEFVDNLNVSTELLHAVISDILDFSKIDAGIIEITPTPTNTQKFIEEVLNIVQYQFNKDENELSVSISDQVPKQILLDQVRLKQVLVNLLSNANKFTEKGKAELSLKVENDRLVFCVSDNGIGMNPKDLENIFNPFVQLDSSRIKKQPGTGLGLSICKKILEAMGSEITVKSTPGNGSTFCFELSCLPIEPKKEEKSNELLSDNTTQMDESDKKNDVSILIVDDNDMNLKLETAILKNHFPSYAFHIAESGAKALEQVRHNKFSLILLDLHMPDFDGFQTYEEMKRLYSPECPIVALTADASVNTREKCHAIGIGEIILKPYSQDDIVSTVKKFVEIT